MLKKLKFEFSGSQNSNPNFSANWGVVAEI